MATDTKTYTAVAPDMRRLIIEGIQERKGRDITLIDLSHIDTAATAGFIIAEGTSTMHASAIAESVEEYVRKNGGSRLYGIDGDEGSDWVVMDYGDIWVHIFLHDTRLRYSLEDLWSDARITDIPNLD